MCQRHVPAGGGAATLAGTRRVALGPGWSGVGRGGVGGHWRNRCLCGKNRKTRKRDGVIFSFFFSFFFFAMLKFFFYPDPFTRGVNLFITRPKKKMKLKLTRCLFLCALLSCFATLCRTPSCALSVFIDGLFLLNVQTWFSSEGPMFLPLQILRFFTLTPVEQPDTIIYPNKL